MLNRRGAQVLFIALGVAAVCGACSNGGDRGELEQRAESPGTLRLPIVTPNGPAFRLRNAVFDIADAGTTVLTLDTEASPDAETLEVALNAGAYTITLQSGWSLERLENDGSATQVRAALLGANPFTFDIRHQRVTALTYDFAIESGQISFGEGGANIAVNVADATPVTACDVRSSAGCTSGQTCLLNTTTGETFCASPGPLAVGAPCTSEQCVAGAQCLALGDGPPTCRLFCDPNVTTFGCSCRSLSVSESVGVCEESPGACDLFSQSGCAAGEACQYLAGNHGTCGVPGGGAIGSSCIGETCAPGLECHGDDPALGVSGTCWEFCDTRVGGCGYYVYSPWYNYAYCRDTGRGNLGLCKP